VTLYLTAPQESTIAFHHIPSPRFHYSTEKRTEQKLNQTLIWNYHNVIPVAQSNTSQTRYLQRYDNFGKRLQNPFNRGIQIQRPSLCLLNGDVPWMEVSQRRGSCLIILLYFGRAPLTWKSPFTGWVGGWLYYFTYIVVADRYFTYDHPSRPTKIVHGCFRPPNS